MIVSVDVFVVVKTYELIMDYRGKCDKCYYGKRQTNGDVIFTRVLIHLFDKEFRFYEVHFCKTEFQGRPQTAQAVFYTA